MITLYDHQETFLQRIGKAFLEHRAVMGQAPTGAGKTVIASAIAQRAQRKGKTVIFAVHRRNLIKQTADTFDQFNIRYGMIAAGMAYDRRQSVYIASIDTLRRRLGVTNAPDLLVIDEAHMAASVTWAKTAHFYRSRGSRVLGLSATPTRLDGKPLSDLFDHMVKGPSVSWLIERGYLSRYVAYAPSAPDLEDVHTKMGDFNKRELAAAVDRPTLTGDAAKHYLKLAAGTRAICYCCSIDHSKHVAAHFNANGIPAVHIDGTTAPAIQQEAIRGFADGKYNILCNVELITTGFDLSAQVGREVPVETIIMLRPTQSLALCLQMIGRGMRRKPNPAVILDHSGNLLRHGLPDDERDWVLEAEQKKAKKQDEASVPIKQCPTCYHVHKPAPTCPACGHVYEIKARKIDEVDGELQELTREQMEAKRKRQQIGMAKDLNSLIQLGRARGYKNPELWARFVIKGRKAKAANRAA